jgi:hypothetical protein
MVDFLLLIQKFVSPATGRSQQFTDSHPQDDEKKNKKMMAKS